MIFVTLGSQKFQFNRLLEKIDSLITAGAITEEVFAQTGYSDYVPLHFAYQKFLDGTEFKEKMKQADIVITHGGTGAIINAVKQHKIVIAVPRQSAWQEHVDDHQKEIVREFGEQNYIQPCMEVEELGEALAQAGEKTFSEYRSNTDRFINDIDAYLQSEIIKKNYSGSRRL